jgi:hypothetical protein
MHRITLSTILIFLIAPILVLAQETVAPILEYGVYRIYPPVSITKENLIKAETLKDINKNYPSSWIKEYISVEISAISKGTPIKAISKSDILSEDQKEVIYLADLGSEISVWVQYIPDNNFSNKEIKEIDFAFSIDPVNDAQFIGGQDKLLHYLKENLIEKIPTSTFQNYDLASVTFSIDEKGLVVDPLLHWSSNDEKVDKLLLEVICNMPPWQPAKYASGETIMQAFTLLVGNMESCTANLLNIRKD